MHGRATLDRELSFEAGDVRVNVLRIHPEEDGRIVEDGHIQELGRDLLAHLASDSRADYVLYFGDVKMTTSAALGKLIEFNRRHQELRGSRSATLTNLSDYDRELIKVTRLDDPSGEPKYYFEVDKTIGDYKKRRFGAAI